VGETETEGRVFKGQNGNLILSDAGITLRRGAKGFLVQQAIRGDKFVPWESVVAVQMKKAGLTAGYLQLSLRGGSEAKAGLTEAMKDENTITFSRTSKNKEFQEAHDLILGRINAMARGVTAPTTPIEGSDDTKVCPDCAETVKEGAKVCRFCGYRFEDA
jgi:hypothetical protein